jgi:hypothetical protein
MLLCNLHLTSPPPPRSAPHTTNNPNTLSFSSKVFALIILFGQFDMGMDGFNFSDSVIMYAWAWTIIGCWVLRGKHIPHTFNTVHF